MRNFKMLLLLALFGFIFFGVNSANAQSGPVRLVGYSSTSAQFQWQTSWYVTLYNTTTHQEYSFFSDQTTLEDDGSHFFDYVPAGTYDVTVAFTNPNGQDILVDQWSVNDHSGSNIQMWQGNPVSIATGVTVDGNSGSSNYGLNIWLYVL